MSWGSLFKLGGWITVAYTVLTLGGAGLLFRALWPARRGKDRFCRNCRYNLTGLNFAQSPRCPKCGERLLKRRAVQRGVAPGRSKLKIAGALLMILMGVLPLAISCALAIDWYRQAPLFVLAMLATDSDAGVAEKAVSEVCRRIDQMMLTGTQFEQAVNILLGEQRRMPLRHATAWAAADELGLLYGLGQLSDGQRAAFLDSFVLPDVRGPTVALAGSTLTLTLVADARIPMGYCGVLHVRQRVFPADEVPTATEPKFERVLTMQMPGFSGPLPLNFPIVVPADLGRYRVQVETEFEALSGDSPARNFRLHPNEGPGPLAGDLIQQNYLLKVIPRTLAFDFDVVTPASAPTNLR